MLPLIRPDVHFEEIEDDLQSILASGVLTGGPYVDRFEGALAAVLGVPHVVATTSATTGLHLALAAAGIGPGDEVLVSDFTFPASGNVIVQTGATPVLVDSCPDRFVLDLEQAESKVTDRTRAIMPVHPFGQPVDLDAVAALADRHGLVVVEDAACALGSAWRDTPCGGGVGAGCFSFHPRKVVTTGEGGAVATADPELAARMRSLRSHGGQKASVGMTFVEHGFNYRLGAVPAAIGLAQLRRLPEILSDRRATALRYEERLEGVPGVELRLPGVDETWSYQSFVVMLDDEVDRDAVVATMRAREIETTLGTYSMHSQPAFAGLGLTPGDLPASWRAQCQSLTLPVVPHMAEAEIDEVVAELTTAIERSRRA